LIRILLFGKNGQLGWELNRSLITLGELTVLDYPDVDFAKPETLRPLISSASPNIIINAIAYTNVDKAEKEPELCHLINATSVGVLAEEALRQNALLLHYSTDYVFDGRKASPYTEEDQTNAISSYARSKIDAEEYISQIGGNYLLFRTGWMYSLRRDNFLLKVLKWARNNQIVQIANDQIGSPTSARLLAEITTKVLMFYKIQPEWLPTQQKLFHVAGDGYATRFEWAQSILKHDAQKVEWVMEKLEGISANKFPTEAQRPENSALDCTRFHRTFQLSLPQWERGIELLLEN
jgi:dTDP-4-dehydrorhamnose reductase